MAGTARVEHYREALSILRFRNYSRESIADLGHALHHAGERTNQSITSKTIANHAAIVVGIAPRIFQPGDGPRVTPTLEQLKAGVIANHRQNPHLALRAGYRPASSEGLVTSALRKCKGVDGLTILTNKALSPNEATLLEVLVSTLASSVAYTLETLFADLQYILHRNGLAPEFALEGVPNVKRQLGVIALHAFHGARFRPRTDGPPIIATMWPDDLNGASISASHPLFDNGSQLGFTIFSTDLSASDVLAPEAIAALRENRFDPDLLEIGPDFLMRPFQADL